MKTRIYLLALLLAGAASLQAQQTATLYFLENAPMRQTINPAFQPVSKGYLNFTPLGYMNFNAGNNSLTLSDLVFNQDGKTITALHPEADRAALLRAIKPSMLTQADMSLNLLSLGTRVKEKGYLNISIMERVEAGVSLPHGMFDFLLNGGMTNLEGTNTFDMAALGMQVAAYTEFGVGYSHRINDKWTVGGKLKVLIGQAYVSMHFTKLQMAAGPEKWNLQGYGAIQMAAPIHFENLPSEINPESIKNINTDDILPSISGIEDIKAILQPAGIGATLDLGVTYAPIKQLEITAAVTDLGFIHWRNGASCTAKADATYTGIGEFEYNKYVVDGAFSTDSLMSDITANLSQLADGFSATAQTGAFLRMPTARLNLGVMGHFLNHKLNVGVVSNTRLFNGRAYEEVTLGGSVTPCNWFNFALSYSLVDNGRYSNIGAGLSFMPYDGINLTLAMDYIPTSYIAPAIPYKTSGFNMALGFSIVWGTNPKKVKQATEQESGSELLTTINK